MERTDAELLESARRDPEAFRLFYERHVAAVFAWLRSGTASAEDAMDLTAETFAQALRSLPRFRRVRADADGSAGGWVFGIARNLLLGYYRERKTAERARNRLGIDRWQYDADELAAVDETSLSAALARLSEQERKLLQLRVVEERPYSEVAARLGCTPVAARSRVFRVLAALRSHLQGGQP